MSRMIFVNLPVKDLDAAMAFYTALGFQNDQRFTDETAAAMSLSDEIVVMLLTEDKFRTFINGEIADPSTTEVLNCLACESREEVDSWLENAKAAGGSDWKPVMDMGPMYGGSFQDPDGHVWEVMHMDMSQIPDAAGAAAASA